MGLNLIGRYGGKAVGRSVVALLFVWSSSPLSAQQRESDQAWDTGRFEEARGAYQVVLAGNPDAFQANLRIGLMLAWQGRHDSALAHIRLARRVEPADPEARLIEARVLS